MNALKQYEDPAVHRAVIATGGLLNRKLRRRSNSSRASNQVFQIWEELNENERRSLRENTEVHQAQNLPTASALIQKALLQYIDCQTDEM